MVSDFAYHMYMCWSANMGVLIIPTLLFLLDPASRLHLYLCPSHCPHSTGTAIDCGSLPDPPFGTVELDGTTLGSVASYTCFDGYTQDGGDGLRTCQEDGRWSGEEIRCRGNQLQYTTT